ncbi:hypothetical protein chiPu_0021720 [Chiloscyllium punctatum]|uniref:Uncharacterized protein n=1 Tax=Chiloscyllium punctatum TaxID=137246 RepID=A0A401RL45_CHIPU|nr:hypothetical protein [Chiloscyllium punctatum]
MVWSGGRARCSLVIRLSSVCRLGLVRSGDWAWCCVATGSSAVKTGDHFTLDTGPCATWRMSPQRTRDWLRCGLETRPSAVWSLGLVWSDYCAQCGLNFESSVVSRLCPVRSGEWTLCGLATLCSVDWRLGLVRSADWA